MTHLEEQIERGRQRITRGRSLGKDTRGLEERVIALEARLKEHRKEDPQKTSTRGADDEIQETLKGNTKQVKVIYNKGNLRIEAPDIRRLFLEIKREFPQRSIVLHDGAAYVAFYYLPVLFKMLQQSFGSIDADSTIPNLEGVRRFLHMGEVNVEVALATEMENPVTKLLLRQKPSEKVAEITRQLKTELKRSQWLDSVWEVVEKAKASTEARNEEELNMNKECKMVDSGLKEMSDVSLAEEQTSLQYHEK